MSCSARSAGEPLAGTVTVASRFLLVEHRGRWGRDPKDDETALDGWRRDAAHGFDGRVLLLRRPDRRDEPEVAFVAEIGGGLSSLDASGAVEELDGPIFLVCAHGRRDRCCARLGVPLFDALEDHVRLGRLWQSSHHGGHRFAANLLVLPHGIQLGRVAPEEAGRVARVLAGGRIPLAHFRGRTADPPRVQAADSAVRSALGLEGIRDVRPLGDDGSTVELQTSSGVHRVRVVEEGGPELPMSCGRDPEPTTRLVATLEEPA